MKREEINIRFTHYFFAELKILPVGEKPKRVEGEKPSFQTDFSCYNEDI